MRLSKRKGLLRIRRVLRSPYMTVGTYLLLLFTVCLLGSVSFWSDYHFYQMPSLLLGAISSLTTLAAGLGLVGIFKWSFRKPVNWKAYLHRTFRHGTPSLLLAILSCLLLAAILLIPKNESPVVRLYSELETTRQLLRKAQEVFENFSQKPKYKDNAEVRFADKVLEYRLKKQMSITEYEQFANVFYKYCNDRSSRVRGWALVLAGDALDRAGHHLTSSALYSQAASDPKTSAYLRRWAYQELGNSAYLYVGDKKAAAEFWAEALKLKQSRGLYENLAMVYSDQNDWSTATSYFEAAHDFMSKYQSQHQAVSLSQQWAILYTNWANMLRRQALHTQKSDQRRVLLQEAEALLLKTRELDEGLLDHY